MGQDVIIAVLFIAAMAYLGYMVHQAFRARSGCSSGCGSCGIDFEKIRKKLDKEPLR